MSTLDTCAGVALAIAGLSTGLYANLLKPIAKAFTSAPQPVWLTFVVLAAVELGFSLPLIVHASHAGARETVIYVVLSVASVVLVGHFIWQHRKPATAPAAAAGASAPAPGPAILGPAAAEG